MHCKNYIAPGLDTQQNEILRERGREAKFISLAINSLSCTLELSKNIIPGRQAAGRR